MYTFHGTQLWEANELLLFLLLCNTSGFKSKLILVILWGAFIRDGAFNRDNTVLKFLFYFVHLFHSLCICLFGILLTLRSWQCGEVFLLYLKLWGWLLHRFAHHSHWNEQEILWKGCCSYLANGRTRSWALTSINSITGASTFQPTFSVPNIKRTSTKKAGEFESLSSRWILISVLAVVSYVRLLLL